MIPYKLTGHYRALTVQNLYDAMIRCWIAKNYGEGADAEAAIAADTTLQAYWSSLIQHLPSLKRAVERASAPDAIDASASFAGMRTLTLEGLVQFARTLVNHRARVLRSVLL